MGEQGFSVITWRNIAQAFLYSLGVIETLYPSEGCKVCFFTSGEVVEVDAFLLKTGKEAFSPSVITQHPDSREALLDAIAGQHGHKCLRGVLAAAVRVEDGVVAVWLAANGVACLGS